jgi:transposase
MTASSPMAEATDAPTRSEGAIEPGAREEAVMRRVALDLGKRKISFCEVKGGQVLRRLTVSSLETLETELGPKQPAAVVAIEACREAWHVHDLLTSWGNQVIVVDTTRVRQLGIGQHGRKTDRIDAEILALAVERGRIPMAHVLSPARRELRRWLGVRRGLVETRAQLVTTARGICRELGQSLPSCGVKQFLLHVRKTALKPEVQAVIAPLLNTIETVSAECQQAERRLAELAAQEPVIQLLATAPGVATIVAAAFVSVIDDAGRFEHAHQVESYLGLVPGENSSGGKRRVGAITKAGNCYVRSLLIESAWTILRNSPADDPLRQWGHAIVERRGNRIGVIALARRLVGVLWAMWRRDTYYDPRILAAAGGRGLKRAAQTLDERAEALRRASRKQRVLKPVEATM